MPETTVGHVLIAIAELKGEIRTEMSGLRSGMAGLDARLKHVEHDVVGNGKEGLKTKVDRLEQAAIAERNQWLDLKKNGPLIAIIVVAVFGGNAGVQALMTAMGWGAPASVETSKTPPPDAD